MLIIKLLRENVFTNEGQEIRYDRSEDNSSCTWEVQ